MPEEYFAVCSRFLEVNVRLMVKAAGSGSRGIRRDGQVAYLRDVRQALPSLSIFHMIPYLRHSQQDEKKMCFVSPASGYLLSNSFI